MIPDLMLLDIRMPGMDGFEVCSLLKKGPNTSDVPIIFISAQNENDDKVHAFKIGGVDFASKPFQAEEILARVKTHLSLRRMQKNLNSKTGNGKKRSATA